MSPSPFKSDSDKEKITNLKITLENLVGVLSSGKYDEGIDRISMCHTIDDIYRHIAGDQNSRIRLPAPANDIDDKFGLMWPEGAVVSSRAASDTSRRSSMSKSKHKHDSSRRLSSKFTNGNVKEDLTKRALSVTSGDTSYSKRYIGFIDEDDDDTNNYQFTRADTRRKSSSGNNMPGRTMKVNGAVVKPTPSLEKMFNKAHINDAVDDEEEEYAPRPASSRHIQRVGKVQEPLRTPSTRSHGKKTKIIGFADD